MFGLSICDRKWLTRALILPRLPSHCENSNDRTARVSPFRQSPSLPVQRSNRIDRGWHVRHSPNLKRDRQGALASIDQSNTRRSSSANIFPGKTSLCRQLLLQPIR